MDPIALFLVRQVKVDAAFRGVESGVIWTPSTLPVGAVWEADWMGDPYRVNGTGPVLVIRLPDGRDWMPGSQAANCTRKDEEHDCWCVHGEAPHLHIDKHPEPGRSTCAAGAGSIGASHPGGWHGFVHHGQLVGV